MAEEQDLSSCGVSFPLFRLPRELRDHIYHCLFTSTRLTFGERPSSGPDTIALIKPALNSLAILRACRQISGEASPLWLSRVLFNFECLQCCLHKLRKLPTSTLSQIRYIRVGGDPRPPPNNEQIGRVILHARVLSGLPGLRLERLMILAPADPAVAYEDLERLIERSNGWRELHYITRDSEILRLPRYERFPFPVRKRMPQPSGWKDKLLKRDGLGSGAFATVYQATELGSPGCVLDASKRQTIEQDPSGFELARSDAEAGRGFTLAGEYGKELLVVVRRGSNVDVVQRKERRDNSGVQPVREHTGRRRPRELLRSLWKNNFYHSNSLGDQVRVVEAERYCDVDELSWEPPNSTIFRNPGTSPHIV
ncbi:hypothetical protein FQN54_002433 [Arachnomyces sp. PD_36]|nr:hypothetical protein FQN54_002433 [Arachnomyces sp. PD_36]